MAAVVPGKEQAADLVSHGVTHGDTRQARRPVLLYNAQPFGHDGEAFRIHVPRLEFGVERLQADLFVMPLVLAGGNFAAGVALDGVARAFLQHAEALNEQDLALPRARRVEAEEIQTDERRVGKECRSRWSPY